MKFKPLVTKFIDEDIIRQKALMELAVQFENASAAKSDFRKAYEKCYDITHESRALIDTFLKQESNKDYDMNLALYRKAAKIENQIESKFVWLSQNTNSFLFPLITYQHLPVTFFPTFKHNSKFRPCPDKKITTTPGTRKKTTDNHPHEAIHSLRNHRGGPSSKQGSLTDKEYQELLELQDEEALRQTLKKKQELKRSWRRK
ncbi:hypothetical protein Tco_1113500 [Tanacetum coccineum]|uniref:Uncharacterized protein n=1 Tax=Tanacetum coccineum TaxID=301880 RepID=A0ABQ5ISE0_9ASTR